MAEATPRAEYARRMQRVLAHIDSHLAAPLALKTLAEVAHFSPYHFHRVFAGWTGETLGDYLRRRRLEVAASFFRHQPERPVLTVALDVGFGSGEALARAFKSHFGCSPSTWREQQRHPDQAERNPDQAGWRPDGDHAGFFPHLPELATAMNVQLTELPEVRLASLRHTGPYGPAVGEFWCHQFWPWARSMGLTGGTRYGLSYDDPSVKPPDQCRYDAGIEVPAGFVADSPATLQVLPGGRYAVARFRGTSAEIGSAWRWLFHDWLPDSGWQVDNRPCFEREGPGDAGNGPGQPFECDICIPVRAL